jgi:acyl-coenzyme A synthetase/AMP-(fatty) acid ligase
MSLPFRQDDIEQSIPERFKQQVAQAPGSIAVRTRTSELSFARLDSWSNAIAAELLRLGAGSEPVPFLLPQGPLAIATTLGILKAGGMASAFGGNFGIMDIYAVQQVFGVAADQLAHGAGAHAQGPQAQRTIAHRGINKSYFVHRSLLPGWLS